MLIRRGRPDLPGRIVAGQDHLPLRTRLGLRDAQPVEELPARFRHRRAVRSGEPPQVLGGFQRAPVAHRHDRAAQPRDLRFLGGRMGLQHPVEQLASDHRLAGLVEERRGQDERDGRARIRRELPGDPHPRQAGLLATPQTELGPTQGERGMRGVGRQLVAQQGRAVALGCQAMSAHSGGGVPREDQGGRPHDR
jgi:hypothetical protein